MGSNLVGSLLGFDGFDGFVVLLLGPNALGILCFSFSFGLRELSSLAVSNTAALSDELRDCPNRVVRCFCDSASV